MNEEKISLSSELEPIYNEYYANNGSKLCGLVDKILGKFGGISQSDYADFYSIANGVMADIARKNKYDSSQPFEGYLYSCLSNKFKTEMTARNRYKRMADRNTISMDTPIGDETESTVGDFLCSNFDIHEEAFHENDSVGEKAEEFLKTLSPIQREILEMRSQNIPVDDIRKKLKISNRQFDNLWNDIKSFSKISILLFHSLCNSSFLAILFSSS